MERTLSNISGRVKAAKGGKKHCRCDSRLLAEGWKRSFQPKGGLCGRGELVPRTLGGAQGNCQAMTADGIEKRLIKGCPPWGLCHLSPLRSSHCQAMPAADGPLAGHAGSQADVLHWDRAPWWGGLAASSVPVLASQPQGWTPLEFAKYFNEKWWPKSISAVEIPVNFFFWSNLADSIFFYTFHLLLTQFLALLIPRSCFGPYSSLRERERDQCNLGRCLQNLCTFSIEKDGDKEIQWQSTSSRLLVLCFKPERLDEAAIISVVSDLMGRAALPDQRNTSKHYQNYDNSFI